MAKKLIIRYEIEIDEADADALARALGLPVSGQLTMEFLPQVLAGALAKNGKTAVLDWTVQGRLAKKVETLIATGEIEVGRGTLNW